MENKEKLEIVGLDKKPKYWDDRYMDAFTAPSSLS